MESLPTEILQHISSFLARRDLVKFMLTSRNYVDSARHALYADLRINFFSPPTALLHAFSEQRSCALLGPLQLSHPALLVRHFTATAAALAHPRNQALLRQSLAQMSNLISLDISIKTFPDSIAREVFTDELCGSPAVLPNLLALKTDDVLVAIALVPGRPVYSVCVNDNVTEALSSQLLHALENSKSTVSQLQVRLDVADNDAAAATFHTIAAAFTQLAALCVEFNIVNPSERPLTWTTLKVSYRRLVLKPCLRSSRRTSSAA